MSVDNSHNEQVTDSNISFVRKQIQLKQGHEPYYGTINQTSAILTDMDHFPYTRFYRGVPDSSKPIIYEREAGWRPQRDSCYNVNKCQQSNNYPNHCFESACSTVYPCYPEYLQKQSDRNALNVQLNRACIVQYR
jgi:hypothetical protein